MTEEREVARRLAAWEESRKAFDLPDGGQGAGEAVDVDEEGRLVVRTDSGEEHVFTGEVSVRGIYGSL